MAMQQDDHDGDMRPSASAAASASASAFASTSAAAPSNPHGTAQAYWRRNLRYIAGLLAIWLLLTLAPALFTDWLSFNFIGWPFPFWLAAYGAPLAYLLIVAAYVWLMNRNERTGREER